jgi:hypothetical protein
MGALICTEIASGRSLRAICRQDDGMPHERTVFRWLSAHETFSQQYTRAMEARTMALAEELLEIADDGTNDTRVTEDGAEIVNHDHIQRSKLRVDTRKWLMGKLAPKKYGDRIAVGGDDSMPPIRQAFQVEFVSPEKDQP